MFDFVIVGAGSAGCVLANRLSADPKRKVALLEAGGAHHATFKVRAPGLYQTLWRSPLDWAFSTEPQPHSANRRHFWPRGKLLGGTSCLNTLVYIRGHRANYDEWRALGNPGWGWDDVLPYFKKSEANTRGRNAFHGADGPLPVCDSPRGDASRAFVEALATRCKVRIADDFNEGDHEGAGFYQLTLREGQRASTAVTFLKAARKRENLTVITDALATSLVVDGTRVTGVRYRGRSSEETISAREVILAGGAIGSPHLLMLSGIGARGELRAVGVEPRHELPGVGKHLEDHLLMAVVYDVPKTSVHTLTRSRFLLWAAQHFARKAGPLATGPVDSGGFIKLSPTATIPDLQFHFAPWGVALPTDEKVLLTFGRHLTLLPSMIYPRSVGEIRLRSSDPAQAPAIDPRYLSDPADLETLVAGIKLSREIAATAPLSELVGNEVFPGPGVMSDDALRDSVRTYCNTIFHPTGTCKMGTDAQAVVDAELRVRGLSGLRVADASIMPRIIGGNTNAPVIMIAEKAAELLLAN